MDATSKAEQESGEPPDLPTIRRHHSLPSPSRVDSHPFAGRIGGNQIFTATTSDPSYDSIAKAVPDAIGDAKWAAILDLRGFREPILWKTAVIEGVGTGLQVYISGLFAVGVIPSATETSVGPIFPVTFAAIVNFLLISLFIFAAGPVTGAHFNPLITWGTFLTKLSSLPRTVLYTLFQCLGAVVGGFLVRASLGSREPLALMPGCYVDPTLVTPGEAYVLETTTSLFILFLAFGLGLDPRNATAFGPALGPFLIGLSLALTLFGSGFAKKGYLGSSNNPARCLGLMAAGQRFDYHYIHWFGPLTAAM